MKSCPTCNRTFEDSFSFCLVDGAILSAPFDSQATQRIPKARRTDPPSTEVLPSNISLPPTVPASQSSIPQVVSQSAVSPDEQQASNSSEIKRFIKHAIWSGLAGIIVGVIIGAFVNVNKFYYYPGFGFRGEEFRVAAGIGFLGGIIGVSVGYIIWLLRRRFLVK